MNGWRMVRQVKARHRLLDVGVRSFCPPLPLFFIFLLFYLQLFCCDSVSNSIVFPHPPFHVFLCTCLLLLAAIVLYTCCCLLCPPSHFLFIVQQIYFVFLLQVENDSARLISPCPFVTRNFDFFSIKFGIFTHYQSDHHQKHFLSLSTEKKKINLLYLLLNSLPHFHPLYESLESMSHNQQASKKAHIQYHRLP